MSYFAASDLPGLEKIFRLNLINSLTGYKPANLVGTAAPNGATNLAIISSVLHLGSDPALLGFVMRPATVARHTYENIRATGRYTINHVPKGREGAAHYTSANFPQEESEFDACGFTPEYANGFSAPYVQESRVKMGLELLQELPIEANGTVLLVGRVQHIYLPDDVLRPDGSLDLVGAGTICVSGLDGYHTVLPPVRFAYARAGKGPQPLPG